MKKIFLLLISSLLILGLTRSASKSQFEPVAVIELFTSQGCSSCPPADKLLSQTIADAKKDGKKIFALSFHVDYWNRLGWSDPFSDKKYSDRQGNYARVMNLSSIYTPQMVINGSKEFVGSNERSLHSALSKALNTKTTAAFKTLNVIKQKRKPLRIKYTLEGDFAESKINFALVSKKETTIVKRGENSGRTLINENVVRQFVSEKAKESGEIDFVLSSSSIENNAIIIAYVQHNDDLKIVCAGEAEIN